MGDLEKTFKANYKELCLMSCYYTKDIKEAEDIVQDVFVKIIEKQNQLVIKNLDSYLKAAVRNASLKRIAYKQYSQTIDENTVFYSDTNTEEDHELALKKKVHLYKQIDSLPEQCRKIFLLCVLDNLKYQEAADTLGISINTVKTQMKKAFKILRSSLKQIYVLLCVNV